VKLRLEGNQFECVAAVEQLRIIFEVVSVSRPYRSKSRPGSGVDTVRVYVEVRDKARLATAAGTRTRVPGRRRGSRPDASREARQLANALAARFGCPHGTFEFTWIGPKQGWELGWQDGPSREQTRAAVAELAGPALPAFTKILGERKLRMSRTISQRAWALHLLGIAAAGDVVPDLDDTTVRWTTEDHLEGEVAFPERPSTPTVETAAEELLSLAKALQPVTGQGQRVPIDEDDLARLLRTWGFDAIASGAARQTLHEHAGVTALSSPADGGDVNRPGQGPRRPRRDRVQ
jgi:hypothetical protein